LNIGRRLELVRQNTVGSAYCADGGGTTSATEGLIWGVFIVSMAQSLEKVRCAD